MSNDPRGGGFMRGVAWVGSARILVRCLGLVSILVLARLLTPSDFGVVAVAMGVIGLLRSCTELGFSQALIHYRDASTQDYATAWTLNALRGVILMIIVLSAAYPISVAVDDERVMLVLIASSLIPLIECLENPRFVQFEKRMQFDKMFQLMATTKVAGVAIAIICAVVWRSYWALIAGMTTTAFTRTALTFYFAPGHWAPTLRSWRKLMRFSGWLSGSEFLVALTNRLDPILLGTLASANVVGFLHMARELSYTTFNELASPVRTVLLPALSQNKVGDTAFVQRYRSALIGLFMVLAPVTTGLALTAPDAVPLLLGSQWTDVILPIQCFAAALLLTVPGRVAQSAAMAAGRTRLLFMRNLIVLPIKLIAFVIGAYYYGLMGAVVGAALGMLLQAALNIMIGASLTGVTLVGHLVASSRSWVALAGMCAAIGIAMVIMEPAEGVGTFAVRFSVEVIVGVVSYLGLHLMLWRSAGRPEGPEAYGVNAILTLQARLKGAFTR